MSRLLGPVAAGTIPPPRILFTKTPVLFTFMQVPFMAKPKLPPCPHCGRCDKSTREGKRFYCHRTGCRGFYDDNPHEGGTHFADPSWRMQLDELGRDRRRERAGQ